MRSILPESLLLMIEPQDMIKLYPSLFPHEEESLTYTLWRPQRIPLLPIGSFSAISGTISLSFQSSFHLSLTVLVRYRSPTHI